MNVQKLKIRRMDDEISSYEKIFEECDETEFVDIDANYFSASESDNSQLELEDSDDGTEDDAIPTSSFVENDRVQIEYLIELYKQHPVLWDSQQPGYKSAAVRNKAYVQITEAMNAHFDCIFSLADVRTKLYRLRITTAADIVKIDQQEITKSSLWYFDKLSFANCENFFNEKALSKTDVEETEYLIQLYKENSILWDPQKPGYKNTFIRSAALTKIAKELNEKFKTKQTSLTIKERLRSLSTKFKNDLMNITKNGNSKTTPKLWCYGNLSFLATKYGIAELKKDSKSEDETNLYQYKCEFCEIFFKSDIQLKNHLYLRHKIKSFLCEVCRKVFPNTRTLREHSYTHLSIDERPYACKICGARFSQQINVSVHERRHTKNYLHACKICEKSFITSVELKGHIRVHSGEKPFICDECGMSFRSSSNMTVHRQSHTTERSFKCTICPMAFKKKETLKGHLCTHSDTRDYECDTCKKCFKSRKTLTQHKKLHSVVKKYVCNICCQSFSQAAGLYGHKKTHTIVSRTAQSHSFSENLQTKTE